jgi:hypothetical protein
VSTKPDRPVAILSYSNSKLAVAPTRNAYYNNIRVMRCTAAVPRFYRKNSIFLTLYNLCTAILALCSRIIPITAVYHILKFHHLEHARNIYTVQSSPWSIAYQLPGDDGISRSRIYSRQSAAAGLSYYNDNTLESDYSY